MNRYALRWEASADGEATGLLRSDDGAALTFETRALARAALNAHPRAGDLRIVLAPEDDGREASPEGEKSDTPSGG